MKIKQTIVRSVLGIGMVAGFLVVSIPSPVAATECAGVKTGIISCTEPGGGTCKDKNGTVVKTVTAKEVCPKGSVLATSIESTGVWALLVMVIKILTAGVGVLAVAGIVYGSILYTTAGGTADKVSKAREVIRNVVIGIIAYALMYATLNFIIPGGLFT